MAISRRIAPEFRNEAPTRVVMRQEQQTDRPPAPLSLAARAVGARLLRELRNSRPNAVAPATGDPPTKSRMNWCVAPAAGRLRTNHVRARKQVYFRAADTGFPRLAGRPWPPSTRSPAAGSCAR